MISDPIFRWDLARRAQLGRLLDGLEPDPLPRDELEATRSLAARVLGASAGGDLWFIGRSLEPVFDYLSGLFTGVAGAPGLSLVNVSLFGRTGDSASLRAELRRNGLHPLALYRSPRPQVLCDVIYSGGTMETLVNELAAWSADTVQDANAVLRQLRILGVLQRTKPSPNTERWSQEAAWLRRFPTVRVENLSIDRSWWSEIADRQPKVSLWNPPQRWGAQVRAEVQRNPGRLVALGKAVALFDAARERAERRLFRTELSRTRAVRERWGRRYLAMIG